VARFSNCLTWFESFHGNATISLSKMSMIIQSVMLGPRFRFLQLNTTTTSSLLTGTCQSSLALYPRLPSCSSVCLSVCLSVCARGVDVWIWNRRTHSSNHNSQLDSFTSDQTTMISELSSQPQIIRSIFIFDIQKINLWVLTDLYFSKLITVHYYKCNGTCIPLISVVRNIFRYELNWYYSHFFFQRMIISSLT
jgi:hypothetical protein